MRKPKHREVSNPLRSHSQEEVEGEKLGQLPPCYPVAPQLQPPPQVSCHQINSHPSTSWAFYLRAGQFLSCSNVFHGSLLPLIMSKSFSLVFKTIYEVSPPSSLPAPCFSFSLLPQSLIDTPRSSHPGCLAVPLALGGSWRHMSCCRGLAGFPLPSQAV